jgi:hypothetical protein
MSGDMTARRVAAALTVVLVVLSGVIPATAHDHRPPRAELRYGSLLQEGRLIKEHWSSRTEDGGCVSSLVVGNARFPRPGLPVGAGRFRAALRLSRSERPADLSVSARRGRGPGGRLLGKSQAVASTLRPRRAGGEVIGWAAVLRSRIEEELYLRVIGSWDDRQGCQGDQKAVWLFHVSAD